MSQRLLLCTDLDRTLLPNGSQPESTQARELFRSLVARPEVTLAYVTGRHRALVEAAIDEYRLPLPDYVIGDVGTSIYEIQKGGWRQRDDWHAEIATDWAGCSHADLQAMFEDIGELQLQEPDRQNRLKLSYYVAPDVNQRALMKQMHQRLQVEQVRATLVWSIDEAKAVGLLDVLPASATKLHAVIFLRNRLGHHAQDTLFAGDSGNDMPVLVSDVRSILVANASADVRESAISEADANGNRKALYLAAGGFLGMNGNYGAGILEGVAYYRPDYKAWMTRIHCNE